MRMMLLWRIRWSLGRRSAAELLSGALVLRRDSLKGRPCSASPGPHPSPLPPSGRGDTLCWVQGIPCDGAGLHRVPFASEGESVFSKHRRVFGVACDIWVVCSLLVRHRRRRQTVGPPGGVSKDPPPSSLDCPSRWCRSLFHPAKRKDVCRVEGPFARILNGAPCASPSPLWIPACAGMTEGLPSGFRLSPE